MTSVPKGGKKPAVKKVSASKTTKTTKPKKTTKATAKKTVVKKVVKAKAKTVSNKTQKAKKTVKAKKATTKKTSSKNKIEEKLHKKLSGVEKLHSNTKPKEVKKEKASRTSLLVLSPFRLPVDINTLATSTARFGGLAFVFLGAVFATAFSQLFLLQSDPSLLSNTTCDTNNLSCLLKEQKNLAMLPNAIEQSESKPTSVAVDETLVEHPVTYKLSQQSPVSEKLTLTMEVLDAEAVSVYVFSKNWTKNIDLGRATRKANNAWEFVWDTSQFDNGEYVVKTLIKTKNGSYESLFDETVLVENEELTTIEPQSFPIELSLSDDETKLEIVQNVGSVETGDEIKLYLKDKDTKEIHHLATVYANGSYLSTDFVLKKSVYVNKYPAGDYSVIIHHFSDSILKSESVESLSLSGYTPTVSTSEESDVDFEFAQIVVPDNGLLRNFVEISIESSDATGVELYAVNTASVNDIYLGRARKVSGNYWVINWDTKDIPNSTYNIYARIKTRQGSFDSERVLVNVVNEVRSAPTVEQLEDLKKKAEEIEKLLKDNIVLEDKQTEVLTEVEAVVEPVAVATSTEVATSSSATTTVSAIDTDPVVDFRFQNADLLSEVFDKYTAAIRSGNEASIKSAEVGLLNLENEFKAFALHYDNNLELQDRFNQFITARKDKIENDIKIVNEIVANKKGEGMFVDSDKDEVSDFDEIYIYKTDPFSADTSGNGVPDGVAIISGLDPLSTDRSQSIVFESPKETGVVREDILTVESLTPVKKDEEGVDTDLPETASAPFVISGTGLPNSFVTIYVFSLPTIVTVRTESDGSWSYRFDKELEDGEHSIYVALTDNSGSILARSNPLSFVKEAEAFSVLNESSQDQAGNIQTYASPYTFLTSSLIYLSLSFGVVAIGLILLMLGMYLDYRKKRGYGIELQAVAN